MTGYVGEDDAERPLSRLCDVEEIAADLFRGLHAQREIDPFNGRNHHRKKTFLKVSRDIEIALDLHIALVDLRVEPLEFHVLFPQLAHESGVLPLKKALFDGLLRRGDDLLDVERFDDVIERSALDRGDRGIDIAETGDDDDGQRFILTVDLRHHLDAGNAGKAHIGDDSVERFQLIR